MKEKTIQFAQSQKCCVSSSTIPVLYKKDHIWKKLKTSTCKKNVYELIFLPIVFLCIIYTTVYVIILIYSVLKTHDMVKYISLVFLYSRSKPIYKNVITNLGKFVRWLLIMIVFLLRSKFKINDLLIYLFVFKFISTGLTNFIYRR